MKLIWRDPTKELPHAGELVWALHQHGKEHKPRSVELMCGEVFFSPDGRFCQVGTNDFTGYGSWGIYLKVPDEELYQYDSIGIAWLPVEELPLPKWVPHNKWWGEPNT